MDKAKLQRNGKWLLSAVFLVAIAYIVIDRGRKLDWAEIGHALANYGPHRISSALALAALAYAACAAYDLLARRFVRHSIPTPTVLAIAFTSYAVNLNVGALLGGLGLRYRLYSRFGLDATQTTQIIGLAVVANWAGFILLGGGLLLFFTPPLPEALHMGRPALRGVGVLMLGVVAAYLVFCALFEGRKRSIRGTEFECPSLRYAAVQLLLSVTNWTAASASVYLLLPASVEFPNAMLAFMASGLGGLIVRLPAGIGVLEGTFLTMFGGEVGHARLMAALLAFRAVYYIAPLILALVLHVALEARAKATAAAA